MEKKVENLESTLNVYRILISGKQDSHDSIQVDPGDHAFQLLDSGTTTFLVSVSDVSPYLNGYRIKLSIGNPSAAEFNNATLTIKWSRPYDWTHYTEDSYKQWQGAVHEKEVTLTSKLESGAWNYVDIDLVPCAADETGYMQLSLKAPTVLLNKR